MFVWWDKGTDSAYLGEYGTHYCATCRRERPIRAILRYTYQGLFDAWQSVRAYISERRYFLFCPGCRTETPIDPEMLGPLVNRERIPFWHKHGLLTAALALPVGLGAIYLWLTG
jgi:hypothetical protein